MKKLFCIYIAFPLFLVYGRILCLLWQDLNYFLHKHFEGIFSPDLFGAYNNDCFWAFLYFSFFILALGLLLPKFSKTLIARAQYFESKCKIPARAAILLAQFLCVLGILFALYYFTCARECVGLKFPGKCACADCAIRPAAGLYTWGILYAFIAEPLYNWCRRFLPEFIFKFDKKLAVMVVCAALSLFCIIALDGVWDFELSLNFDFRCVLFTVFMLPFIYMVACGYNAFLSGLHGRGKTANLLLLLAFAAFPFLFALFFCAFDYFLRKRNAPMKSTTKL